MRKVAALGACFALMAFVVSACGKKDDPNSQANAAASVNYGQPGAPQPGYPQQGYPQQQPGAYPTAAQPGYPAAPPAQQLAVPGPAALPCQQDAQCLTHKCNTQYGKCAFPCESDFDCVAGAYCFKGGPAPACLPKAPGQQ